MSRTLTRSRFKPRGWHTVTPRIVARDAGRLVAFLKRVFDADGAFPKHGPAEVRIGDSIVMISHAETRKPMAAFLYVYVKDIDATYRRAVAAGARTLEKPSDLPYGDRRCMIEDRWGNIWQIATRLRSARVIR